MAEKISTLILKVDLECHLCYKKIRKTLCKIQERENIRSIAYDEKKNTVTVSGPFDPNRLSKKLCCKACKVIKDIQIVESKEKEKEKPKDPKTPAEQAKPEKEKPKGPAEPVKPDKEKPKGPAEPAKPEKEKPKPSEPSKPEKEKSKPPAEPIKPEKEKPRPAPKPDLPYADPVPVVVAQGPQQGYPSAWPAGPVCGCGPWYEAHYGGCRCCSCGRTYGWLAAGPPGDGSKACQFFSEEDPTSACNVM